MERLIFSILIFILSFSSFAQGDWHRNLRIGSTALDSSAVFQVDSSTKGSIFSPKMSTAARTAISSPTSGLGVWDTTLNKRFDHDGTTWHPHVYEDTTATLTNKTIDDDDNTIQDLSLGAIKTSANLNVFLQRDGSGNVTDSVYGPTDITSRATDASVVHLTGNESIAGVKTFTGKFVASSTTSASTPCPVMTSAERDAIASPSNGDCVFNSTTKTINVYDSTLPAWSEVSGAGGDPYNVISDAGFEDGIGSIAAYDDGAAAPVDASGGTSTTTCTITTSSPLSGTNSLLLSKSAGANYQGEGCAIPFTIPAYPQYQLWRVKFDVLADTNFDDDDLKVYAISSAGAVVEVINSDNGIKANTSGYSFDGTFQATDATSWTLAIHVYDTDTDVWTAKFDTLSIKRFDPSVKGAVVSKWYDYTPTTGLTGGANTITGKYRQVGDEVEVRINAVFGTIFTGGSATFTLPTGLVIDTTKLPSSYTTYSPTVGTADLADISDRVYRGPVLYNNTTSVTVRYWNDDQGAASDGVGSSSVTTTAPFTWANSDAIALSFKVPVSGWGAMGLSEDGGTRQVASSYTGNGGEAITANVTEIPFATKVYDYTGSWDGDQFTAPESGIYDFSGSVRTGSISATVSAYIGGVGAKGLNKNTTGLLQKFDGSIYLTKGQVLSFRLDTGTTLVNSTTDHWVSIAKQSSPQTLAGGVTVAARYETAAGQSIDAAAQEIVDYGTKVYDTHNAVTTGASWKFTAPETGKYSVVAGARYASAAFTLANGETLWLFKNGSAVSQIDIILNQASGTYGVSLRGSDDVNLTKGDYIDIRAQHDEAAAKSLVANALYNYVAIKKVGN